MRKSISYVAFPFGADNRARDYALPKGDKGQDVVCRHAVNVRFDNRGQPRLRPGAAQVEAHTGAHSGWSQGDYRLFVKANTLYAFDGATSRVLKSGLLSNGPMAYAVLGGHAFCSNGVDRIRIAGTYARHWGMEIPMAPTLTAINGGGMAAGDYTVSVTWIDDYGEESGASDAVKVAVEEGGGILLSGVGNAPTGAIKFTVYCTTAANSIEQYWHNEYPIGTASVWIGAFQSATELATINLTPPPAGSVMAAQGSRLYIAVGNTLYRTEPAKPGLHDWESTMSFDGDITMLASVSDGLYVAADETWFVSGLEAATPQRVRVAKYGAPRQSSVLALEGGAVAWMSHEGLYMGGPGGQTRNLTQAHIAMSHYDAGSGTIVLMSGSRYYVGEFQGGTVNPMMDAGFKAEEIVRTGSAL